MKLTVVLEAMPHSPLRSQGPRLIAEVHDKSDKNSERGQTSQLSKSPTYQNKPTSYTSQSSSAPSQLEDLPKTANHSNNDNSNQPSGIIQTASCTVCGDCPPPNATCPNCGKMGGNFKTGTSSEFNVIDSFLVHILCGFLTTMREESQS